MTKVSRSDIEQVVDKLHAAAIGDLGWGEALGSLNALVPCELATMEVMDPATGGYADFQASRLLDINTEYLSYYFRRNPRLHGVLNRPDLLVMGDYDFLSESQMGRNEFYGDFLRPNGLRYCAGVRTVHGPDVIGTFSLQRSPRHGHITEEDLEILERLRPHMRRATLTWLRFGRLQAESELLSSLLSRVEDGMIVVGPSGRVRYMNAAGEAICRREDGVSVSNGALTFRAAGAQALLSRAIAEARGETPPEPRTDNWAIILRRADMPPYLVTVVPIPQSRERRFDRDRGSVVVWIRDPARTGRPANTLLRDAFGLTEAESEVAHAIAGGLTARRIAQNRGVSITTVRSQVQSILQKTHLHRQADLVRLLARLELAGR